MRVIGTLHKVILNVNPPTFFHIKDSVSYFIMYSLQAGWPEARFPEKARKFHSPKTSRPAQVPTESPIHLVREFFHGNKTVGAWSWLLSSS